MTDDQRRRKVIIIGGGFGGLEAARKLGKHPVEVTIVDRNNYHLFQPLLYQVAMGELSPGDIASPIRTVLKKAKNTRIILDEVTGIDIKRRTVALADMTLDYDYLVVAAGSENNYFGNDGWRKYAPGLKSIEEALEIRKQVLYAFEAAEKISDKKARIPWLTFVIVGAGATGVELAGALGDITHYTLRNEFTSIDPTEARIILVDRDPRVLNTFPDDLSQRAAIDLKGKGVTLKLGTAVNQIGDGYVELSDVETNANQRIDAKTIIWAAGVKASPLGSSIAAESSAELDRHGKVPVEPDLSIADHSEVFVIGDLAHCTDKNGELLPALAPVAMQQGRYVAKRIIDKIAGRPTKPFRYFDKGNLATIGRSSAVGIIGRYALKGAIAWLAWLFIHLMYLVEYENRLLVLTQWVWNYITWGRGVRLITHLRRDQSGVTEVTVKSDQKDDGHDHGRRDT